MARGTPLPPVVGFIDMDCFYVAVERARDKRLAGKPCAVVQYPTGDRGRPDLPPEADRWRKGGAMGGIIAVSYEARAKGVTRQMSGAEARKACPEIILVQVPTAFGKADLRIYKEAGDAVVQLLAQRCDATEKRSVDEVAIDITTAAQRLLELRGFEGLKQQAQQATHLADSALSRAAAAVTRNAARQGHDQQQARQGSELAEGWEDVLQRADLVGQRLIAGAVVVAELRAEVEEKLGFTCSGGIATNKILAKLGCGLHKPNQQTLLLPHAAPVLLADLPLDRLPGLGAMFGQEVKTGVGVETCGQLLEKQTEVLTQFPHKGAWLIALARGEDSAAEPVKDRQLVKSLSGGKTFFGGKQLRSVSEVEYWLGELAGELHRRYKEQVEKHQRAPTTIGVQLTVDAGRKGQSKGLDSSARQQPIDLGRDGTLEQIHGAAKACFRRWVSSEPLQIAALGLSLTNMVSLEASTGSLAKYFGKSKAANSGEPCARTSKPQAGPLGASFAKGARAAPPVSDGEVDERVLAELPLNIQQEIRDQLRLKRPGNLQEPAPKKPCVVVEIE